MNTCASCGFNDTSGTASRPSAACTICGDASSGSPPALTPDALPAGTPLQDGRFRVGRVLASGNNMVYLGCEPGLGRLVVIKEAFGDAVRRNGTSLVVSGSNGEEFEVARGALIYEARLHAGLRHPNIPHVLIYFEANNTAYIVIEHRSGPSLFRIVENHAKSKLSEAEALEIFFALAETVAAVHAQSVIHCDLTPNNALYDEASKRLTLLDFGEARNAPSGRTQYGTRSLRFKNTRGTDGYAAHEQYDGSTLGYRCDIYALGATLYFMLSGRQPLTAKERQSGQKLPVLRDVSAHVRRAVERAMALDISVRHESVNALLNELETAAPASRARTPLPPQPPRAASQPMPAWGHKAPPRWLPPNPYARFAWNLAAWASPRVLQQTRKFWAWFLPRFLHLARRTWAWLFPRLLPHWRAIAGVLIAVIFARWSWQKTTSSFTPAPTPTIQPSATAAPSATAVPASSSAQDAIRSRTIPESIPPRATKRTPRPRTPSTTYRALQGTWRGVYDGTPASLTLRREGNAMEGVLTALTQRGFQQIALTAHLNPDGRSISMRQTRIIHGPAGGGWLLGKDEGKLGKLYRGRGADFVGTGNDGNKRYGWAFLKASSKPIRLDVKGRHRNPGRPNLLGTWRSSLQEKPGELTRMILKVARQYGDAFDATLTAENPEPIRSAGSPPYIGPFVEPRVVEVKGFFDPATNIVYMQDIKVIQGSWSSQWKIGYAICMLYGPNQLSGIRHSDGGIPWNWQR